MFRLLLPLLLSGCALSSPTPAPEQIKALKDYERHREECSKFKIDHPGDATKAVADCMKAKGHQ